MIDSIGAILLISDDAPRLAAFYRNALALPLEDEMHEDETPHFGCEIGGVHFAIHPSADWPGEASPNAQSPVVVFHTRDVQAAYELLKSNGVEATPPLDHGFATVTAFRDPDGNQVLVMTPA